MCKVEIVAEAKVLPLGGIDLILGVQWLKSVSPFDFGFRNLQLKFEMEGVTVCLQANVVPDIKLMDSGEFKSTLMNTTQGYFGYLYGVNGNFAPSETVPAEEEILHQLLQEFKDAFGEPTQLPPMRSHNHHIKLKEGGQPIDLRPCKYPYVQTSEFEKIIKELLSTAVIQQSMSPFAFLVSLVRKKR